jgi:hypothetical protein
MKALNVGCGHLVGELGIPAEAQCLSRNPRTPRTVVGAITLNTNVCRFTHVRYEEWFDKNASI